MQRQCITTPLAGLCFRFQLRYQKCCSGTPSFCDLLIYTFFFHSLLFHIITLQLLVLFSAVKTLDTVLKILRLWVLALHVSLSTVITIINNKKKWITTLTDVHYPFVNNKTKTKMKKKKKTLKEIYNFCVVLFMQSSAFTRGSVGGNEYVYCMKVL